MLTPPQNLAKAPYALLLLSTLAAGIVNPVCTPHDGFTPPSDTPAPSVLYVAFTGECNTGLQLHFEGTLKPYVESQGGSATWHLLSSGSPLPSLAPYNQVWVVDMSSGSDAYPTAFAAIAAWFSGGAQTHLIADGRYASSTQMGTSCYPDLDGSFNAALVRNYVDQLNANGGGLVLAADFAPDPGMHQLCDALGVHRFGTQYGGEADVVGQSGFESGEMASLNAETGSKLTLNEVIRTPFPYIWIPLSGKSTIARVNTLTGLVEGEYKSMPDGMGGNPSRTTVDRSGRVWAGNRNEASGDKGSVVLVGVRNLGHCVDRNGNGVIDTSTGLGDVRSWTGNSGGGVTGAADECILNYIRTPGTGVRAVGLDKDNNVWVGGWSNKRHALYNGETGALMRQWDPPEGAYGVLLDSRGRVWSSGWCGGWCQGVTIFDTNTGTSYTNSLASYNTGLDTGQFRTYGLGIDALDYIWATNYQPHNSNPSSRTGAAIMRIDPDTFKVVGRYIHGDYPTGIAVESNNHVWYANRVTGGSVTHLENDFNLVGDKWSGSPWVGDISVGQNPGGLSIDTVGKVWVTCVNSMDVFRFDPRTHAQELRVYMGSGTSPYNYGDMTGTVVVVNTADPRGSWTKFFDAGGPAVWHRLSWVYNTESYGTLTLEARSGPTSDSTLSAAYESVNLGQLHGFSGRFLQVKITIVLHKRDATLAERQALSVTSINAEYTRTDYTSAVVVPGSAILTAPAMAAQSSGPAVVDGMESSLVLESGAARLAAPWGVQPNGMQLYGHAWNANDYSSPTISSTLPTTKDFRVVVSEPGCGFRVSTGDTMALAASMPVAGRPPYTFTWARESDGLELATGESTSWVVPTTWTPGDYSLRVTAVDTRGDTATARVQVAVFHPAGIACGVDSDCFHGQCGAGICCDAHTVHCERCEAGTGLCVPGEACEEHNQCAHDECHGEYCCIADIGEGCNKCESFTGNCLSCVSRSFLFENRCGCAPLEDTPTTPLVGATVPVLDTFPGANMSDPVLACDGADWRLGGKLSSMPAGATPPDASVLDHVQFDGGVGPAFPPFPRHDTTQHGFCYLDGSVRLPCERHPENPCMVCDVREATLEWTSVCGASACGVDPWAEATEASRPVSVSGDTVVPLAGPVTCPVSADGCPPLAVVKGSLAFDTGAPLRFRRVSIQSPSVQAHTYTTREAEFVLSVPPGTYVISAWNYEEDVVEVWATLHLDVAMPYHHDLVVQL